MSVVEVSKTVGQLASAISQKTKELEALKKEYERKLEILDRYIEKIVPPEELKAVEKSIEDDRTKLLQKELRCGSCNSVVYSLKEQSEYILVPVAAAQKKAAEVPELTQSLREASIDEETTKPVQRPPAPKNVPKPSKAHGGKSKRACSYCNEPGHTRARCFKRLSNEPGAKHSE